MNSSTFEHSRFATSGVVAILDLAERFWKRGSRHRGRLRPVPPRTASRLGGLGYYPRKIFEILSAKSCDLVPIFATVNIIVPGKTALARVTQS